MALLRSLPENATLADLRRTYADLLEKLRPYGQRLMRGPSPLTPGEREAKVERSRVRAAILPLRYLRDSI